MDICSTKSCYERLEKLGFELREEFDYKENEVYFSLILEGKKVGVTERIEEELVHKLVTPVIEIITYSDDNFKKVVSIVGREFKVWPWYQGGMEDYYHAV